MGQLSFLTTLTCLWVLFQVSCGQSDCQECDFQTNVSTTEISISFCNYETIRDYYVPELGIYKIELNCSTDCCTNSVPGPGVDPEPMRNTFKGLTPGHNYTFNICIAANRTYTKSVYTRPNPVHGLKATTINTTAVILYWNKPLEHQEGYSYRVETSGCTPAPQNQTEQDSNATITGLTPGTNCSFTVYSQVQNSIEGEPVSVYQYTKPERVSPAVLNRGTNDTIEVKWTSPPGNVENYMVNLTSSYGENQTEVLNSTVQSQLFSGLTAGRKYTVIVTTISGPFAEDSEPVSNATYPNPPGAIHAEEQTTDSITISWGRPQGVDLGQNSFIISYQPHQRNSTQTSNNTMQLVNLASGTLYNISVLTEGPMGYRSMAVTAGIYTRPNPVLGLKATTINTTAVFLHWDKPLGHQEGYSYRVETSGCTPAPQYQTEQDSKATITGLTPGTSCSFTVYSQVQNSIEGEPITVYQYTKPERVSPAVLNRGTNDTIEVKWTSPPGNVEKYAVNLTSSYGDNQTRVLNSTVQSQLFSGLTAGRKYTVIVTTISGPFAEDSEPVSNATYPNPPGVIHALEQTTDSITISWGRPQGVDLGQNSFIISYQPHQRNSTQTSNNTMQLENLASGTLYNISVVTEGPMGYRSMAVTAEIYTRPNPVLGLKATTINTTAVFLHWNKPLGHQEGYSYRVETSGCTPAPQNQTEQDSNATITGLTPGTNCSFTVYSQVQNSIEGEPISVYQYTKPERVSPAVLNRGTNDTIEVKWTSPPGNVEKYMVNLTSNYGDNKTRAINSTVQSQLFSGLTAGRKYIVVVTTISGPFAEDSEPVSNATYPNPPGAIHAEEQTTDSITISWGRPQGMDLGQNSFIISYQPHQRNLTQTSNNTMLLENLASGTLYNISVVTEGPMGYRSMAVTAEIYTRPNPVLGLKATTINTTAVFLHWNKPLGHQEGYSYRVETSGCTPAPQNQTEQDSNATITGLTPGTNCSFTVYSQVQNSIEGEPISVYQYTKPERVSPAVLNRGTNDTIEVKWTSPPGNVEKYMVNLTSNYGDNKTRAINSTVQSQLFSGLTAGRKYTVVVTTISGPFAEDSEPVSNATYPNPPGAIHAEEQTTDSITISWGRPQGMDLGQNSFIISYQPHQRNSTQTSNNTMLLENLASGTLYNISVVTEGPMGYRSMAVTAGIYTRPYPVHGLKATTINTTAVFLHWDKPLEHQEGYSYRVETSGCTPAPQNQTEQDSNATITGLTPGTNCSFTVYSQVQNSIEGEPITVYQYTKPERVSPAVLNRGTNDTIEVKWTSPPGNVENYMVNLTSNYGDNRTRAINSTFQSQLFSGLTAGRKYTVVVSTISGPFVEDSEPVSNATYPNTPGPIIVMNRTTKSVAIKWIPPAGMDLGSFSYIVTYSSSAHDLISENIPLNEKYFGKLVSGTLYHITVATVGLFQFMSQPVFLSVTTRPESVQHLIIYATAVDMISITWEQPIGFKPGYSYNVTVWDSIKHFIQSNTTSKLNHEFTGLVPGTRYNFRVISLTSDGTEGSPVDLTACTDAPPVITLKCEGPDRTGPWLDLTWDQPEGGNEGFRLTWTGTGGGTGGGAGGVTLAACSKSCSHTIERLSYHTQYHVSIRTLGCGQNSSATGTECQTGITDPPEPNTDIGITIVKKRHDMFAVKFKSSVLNGINGPIVAYGVLLTSNFKEFSGENNIGLKKYLNKTYSDWKEDNSIPYLAAANNTDAAQNRNEKPELELQVGSGSVWNGYRNGPLTPQTAYRFALVMFTRVVTKDKLVDMSESLLSISPFYDNDVTLPQNPTVITAGAVGGVLAVLTVITVGLVVFWRRIAKKNPTDIPIEALRSKVSVPVRVEEYEAYHKKQSADTNCGYAEQYEELRSVGTAQSKTSAEAPENKAKNRYINVLPYDASRVKLSIHGSPFDDYINASFVPGYNCKKEYIAAQGPLPGTVDEFWRMIWEKNVHTLVMLTKCNESGRVKCEQYWPSQSRHFKNIAVTTTSEIPLEDWTIRDFDIKNVKTAETRSLRQFHFTAWPDHGVPESTELLINFRHLVREHMEQFSRNSPTVVHCSAGVGRTGTMIAIDHLLFQIERDSMVDLYAIVHDMRMHRALMVQTEEQYVFLHRCALDIIRSRTGTNVDLIYQNTAAMDIYENYTPKKGGAGAV